MAVGELDGTVLEVVGHARPGHDGARVVRRQVAQRDHAEQVAPARVAAPPLARARPPRDHGEGARREGRDEVLAQPVLEAEGQLEGVEQQHRPLAACERVGRARAGGPPHGLGELGRDGGRGGVDGPHVEADRVQAGVARRVRHRGQERRLAHAARAVDPEHAEGVRVLERAAEELELGGPAHEGPPPGAPEAVADRRFGLRP